MFRFLIVGATGASAYLEGCPDCQGDLTKLEEFTAPFEVLAVQEEAACDSGDHPVCTTGPLLGLGSESGHLAFKLLDAQLKFDGRFTWPAGVTLGPLPVGDQTWSEEIHINGVTNQASYHLDIGVLQMCVLLDAPPQVPKLADVARQQIGSHLHEVEEGFPAQFQAHAIQGTVDGEDVGCMTDCQPNGDHTGVDPSTCEVAICLGVSDTQPKWVWFMPSPEEIRTLQHIMNPPPSSDAIMQAGIKFTGYSNSVGDAFNTRACSIGSQSIAMTMFENHPELKDYVQGRIDTRVKLAQRITKGQGAVIPSDLAERFAAKVSKPAETSSGMRITIALTSFMMGVAATFGGMKLFARKKVALAEFDGA